MVRVTFRRDSQGRLSSVVSKGHAERGAPGEDVACAAVSALLQAAWAGLTDVAGVRVSGHRRSGDLLMRWPEEARERSDVHAIVATAERAIEQIANDPLYRDAIGYAREAEPPAGRDRARREIPGRDASKGTPR